MQLDPIEWERLTDETLQFGLRQSNLNAWLERYVLLGFTWPLVQSRPRHSSMFALNFHSSCAICRFLVGAKKLAGQHSACAACSEQRLSGYIIGCPKGPIEFMCDLPGWPLSGMRNSPRTVGQLAIELSAHSSARTKQLQRKAADSWYCSHASLKMPCNSLTTYTVPPAGA